MRVCECLIEICKSMFLLVNFSNFTKVKWKRRNNLTKSTNLINDLEEQDITFFLWTLAMCDNFVSDCPFPIFPD